MIEYTDHELDALIASIPEGWSRMQIGGRQWGVTRTTRTEGKVVSVYAERLGGGEQLSANVWITSEGPVLRPCEVPERRVMEFLREAAAACSA